MKALSFMYLLCLFATVRGQQYIKPATLGIHYALTDFRTAEQIKTTSLGNVLRNKLWSKPPQMMTGFGIDFLKGLTKHIDFAFSLNYTSGIDAFNLPSTNNNNYALYTADALLNIKPFSDKYYVRPFIEGGVGAYIQNGSGFYAPLGAGVQFNVFNAAIVNIQAQYRVPFTKADNPCFFYQAGIATSLLKKKAKTPAPVPPPPVPAPMLKKDTVAAGPPKPIIKNISVTVHDEETGQPLQGVVVTINGTDGSVLTGITKASGVALFSNIRASGYTVTGVLNNIHTTTTSLAQDNFNIADAVVTAALTHNDPRFTLAGYALSKTDSKPVGDATVTVQNNTAGTTAETSTSSDDGSFYLQLEAGSDFKVAGKKAGYISNIENVSTRGLNRSTTLYVKLQLEIDEVKRGVAMVMNKIYFETGKAGLNTAASGDLDKLVKFMLDNPTIHLEISGHTDNVGSAATNNKLSLGRASSVVQYLVQHGIQQTRLVAKGYGASQPVADNNTPEGRARNRRVEIRLPE
ncbi:MAG TPA: OmpA family protein [Chitinophagaceae bacterium]|nr:OmpA family protein [Chitinophagaceae bacterium]